jgi:hypothetical protein
MSNLKAVFFILLFIFCPLRPKYFPQAPSSHVHLICVKRKRASIHAMKAYKGVEVSLHSFLALELDGNSWSDSSPNRYTLGKKIPVPAE